MSVNVGIFVWEDNIGDPPETRVLERKSVKISEKDLHMLPLIGFELGIDIVEGISLEIVGHRRSGIPKGDK